LLDRNLYERADDCRWWALTPELRVTMSGATMDDAARARLCEILKYINGLYTVYTRLFVYNVRGEIVASTLQGQDDPQALGMQIDATTLSRVCALASDQAYYVTPFESNALYDGAPTYVYHAAIRSSSGASQVVGGVGIVFHSAVELEAMLRGGMGSEASMSGFFTDRSGRIISSTDPSRPVGSMLELSADLQQLASGSSLSKVVEHDGQYAVLGCSASSGYREFKVQDGYQDDVLAIVFDPIGPVRESTVGAARSDLAIEPEAQDADHQEYATFLADGVLYALPAAQVLEAISASRLTAMPVTGKNACVGLLDLRHQGAEAKPVWVFDLNRLLQKTAVDRLGDAQILIVEQQGQRLGLMVDELHDVKEFSGRQVVPSPFYSEGGFSLVHQLIRANKGALLIQSLSVALLFQLSLG
jgi:chemotaxis signal transduction protein